ncbi:potassium transporter-domain-containing protein [Plectosphaerella cucumerina]|uniref:Potassium transporter-domain-containing protein n=1 Tax=Plectosphaerella cucumerina TaxID=40658 RepID=A0A8K0X9D2_9PEZI|nr:potassium transporter-domain-containing protein [Plectosphaerella cucumerina]
MGEITPPEEASPAANPPDEDTWDLDQEEKARNIAQDDLKRKGKQTFTGLTLLWLTFQSTGVIYGDIGTSPLYVFSSTFSSQPSHEDLVGAVSIIIWSLTLIVTVKYCFIVLSADDDGQGGTFALYSLLARYANIVYRDPKQSSTVMLERHRTEDMRRVGNGVRNFLETSKFAQVALKITGMLGVALVLADGILTPAQSVLGAVQGIRVADPGLSTDAIVGISCAIIVILFAVQPFGTSKVGTSFAPVVVVWLLFNLCSGIHNLVKHDHTVLKAFSPHFAFLYLVRNGRAGWESLGGLLLAFTGVEALFADLGAFGQRAVQISWLCLAYPCLIFAYVGQAAFIAADETETAFTNPFFYTVPPGSFYFSMVIAVMAAIVASQAMITSAFQLLSQVMRMSYSPHIKSVHTSSRFHHQVYMPLANWILMIGTVIVTAVYNNTTSLGHAYGVCVITVTMITTWMVALIALLIWRIPSLVVLFFFLVFVSLDGAYMSSVMRKVPEGAWFTVVLAIILSSVFVLWRWGKERQWTAEAEDRIAPSQLLQLSPASSLATGQKTITFAGDKPRPSPKIHHGDIATAPGVGIFFDKLDGGHDNSVPKVFAKFIQKFKARPEVVVFFHMRVLSLPYVPPSERYVITRVREMPSCYRLTLRHGYMDDVLTPNLGQKIMNQLMLFITRVSPPQGHEDADENVGDEAWAFDEQELIPEIREEITVLRQAKQTQVVYIMGKQVLRIGQGASRNPIARMARRIGLEAFLWIRENSRAKLADLDVDYDNLIEVGFIKEM